mgnify:CR=1 FL=1
MFSIVIPLYNKELSIKKTLQSVLAQSYQKFEIIIINDGSTDNSIRVIETINDARIRLIHQENQGVSSARNRGIQEAKYDWIAFLDADDLWTTEHLQEIIIMMQKFPEEKVFATSFQFSDKRTMFKHPRREPIFKIDNYFKEATKEILICTDVIVTHKNVVKSIGGFNEKLKWGEDWDLWTRIARKYPIIKSQKITAEYRIDAENRSSNSFNAKKSLVFNYKFKKTNSLDENKYYEHIITKRLRGYIVKRDPILFFKLYLKHKNNVSLLKVFKIKRL